MEREKTTKFALVTADPSQVEIKGKLYPCIILCGRTDEKDEFGFPKRLKRRIDLFPYFYLLEKDYLELKETGFLNSLHIQKIEAVPARNIMKRIVTKIYVQDAGRIGDSIKCVNKWNKQITEEGMANDTVFTYEADLSHQELLPLRWMIDNNIRSGIEIEGVKSYKPIEFSVPLRIWYLDFEAITYREYSTGMNKDEPLMMVGVIDSYENKIYKLYVPDANWSLEQLVKFQKDCTAHMVDIKQRYNMDMEVRECKTESIFLDNLMMLSKEKDPDLITAWNLNRYDLPKWYQRAKLNEKLCITKFSDLSPLGSVLTHSKPIRIKGRVMFDLMVAFKMFTDSEMDSYSLAYVTESEELGIEKIPFEGSSGKCWDKAPDVVLRRNTNDVLIMKALNDKYGVIETFDELRKEFGLLFHESFVRNRVIDTALMRMVQGKVVLSTATYDKVDEEKLLGAIVIKPKKGDHYNVIQLDISRGYPTHIQGFNISPETYREKRTKDCYAVVYDWVDEKTKEPKHFEAYFDRVEMGLLPRLIKFFNDRRTFYQKEMEKAIAAKAPDSEVKKWERRQYNVKKTTNAIYGVMDYPKFRLHRKECTQATAIIGRIIIEELVKFLASIGYEMLYGDTDSTFVKVHATEPEAMQKEGAELQRIVNEHLDQFFKEKFNVTTHASIGFKAVYKKIKFLAPKMYGGKWIWDEKKGWKTGYEFKGISSVRSDASNLEKKAVKQVFMYELDDEIEKIEPFKADIVANLRAHKYSPLDISYPSQIKKRIWFERSKGYWKTDYAFLDTRHALKFPAAARAVIYSNMYMNTDYATGDKPRRLPVKPQLGIDVGQQSLFVDKPIQTYPTQWVYRGKTGGIQEDLIIKVRDIVIVEDFIIPEFFMKCIDWARIEKRLIEKLNKLSAVKESKTKREKLICTENVNAEEPCSE